MSIHQHDSGPTSNDLLGRLIAKHTAARRNDPIVAESAVDVENTENAPAAGGSRGPQAPE
ncbi:MAG: hypothetical protein ABR865_13230 [Terracidiphilus sp.]